MALVLIEETFEVVSGVVLSNFYNVGQILHATRSYPEQDPEQILTKCKKFRGHSFSSMQLVDRPDIFT